MWKWYSRALPALSHVLLPVSYSNWLSHPTTVSHCLGGPVCQNWSAVGLIALSSLLKINAVVRLRGNVESKSRRRLTCRNTKQRWLLVVKQSTWVFMSFYYHQMLRQIRIRLQCLVVFLIRSTTITSCLYNGVRWKPRAKFRNEYWQNQSGQKCPNIYHYDFSFYIF